MLLVLYKNPQHTIYPGVLTVKLFLHKNDHKFEVYHMGEPSFRCISWAILYPHLIPKLHSTHPYFLNYTSLFLISLYTPLSLFLPLPLSLFAATHSPSPSLYPPLSLSLSLLLPLRRCYWRGRCRLGLGWAWRWGWVGGARYVW